MERILIDIDPKGNAKMSVTGIKGPSCKAVTKEFEDGLGKKVSDTTTNEYNQAPEKVKITGTV